MPQIAVVLSGCGVYDGTEVHEAAAALGMMMMMTMIMMIMIPVLSLSQDGQIQNPHGDPDGEESQGKFDREHIHNFLIFS